MATAPRHTASRVLAPQGAWGTGVVRSAKRLAVFVRERFPLVPSLVGAALFAGGVDVVGARLLGQAPRVDGVTVVCAACIAALFFILRVVDELRDEGEDREAHPDRPLVRGATHRVDVIVAALVCAAVATLALASVGWAAAGAGAAVICSTVALQLDGGSKRIRAHALLTLAVHQTMVPLWAVFVLAVRQAATAPAARAAINVQAGRALAPLLLLALLVTLLFELGRKVHHPQDENPLDDSYSRLWGTRRASAAISVAAGALLLCVAAVVTHTGMPVWPVGVAGVCVFWVWGTALRLAVWPRPRAGTAVAISTGVAPVFVYLPLMLGALCG